MGSTAYHFHAIYGLSVVQEHLSNLGLNGDHSGEVLQAVLKLMVGSVDPG